MIERNTETASVPEGSIALRLGSLELPKSTRFPGLPLSHEDMVTLLCFAKQLAELFQTTIERSAGRPVSCELVDEIRQIVARAEFRAKVEVLQALDGEAA